MPCSAGTGAHVAVAAKYHIRRRYGRLATAAKTRSASSRSNKDLTGQQFSVQVCYKASISIALVGNVVAGWARQDAHDLMPGQTVFTLSVMYMYRIGKED